IPVSLDGEALDGVALVQRLNTLAGEHGVGRIDHMEDRLVGIKSREIYEAPAAIVLTQAHQAVESLTLAKDQLRFKARVSQEYSELIYNGLWFSGMRHDLEAYVRSTQRNVSGQVRVRLHRATSVVVGREAKASLYQVKLSTYGDEDAFDHTAAEGFIKIWGLPVRTQAEAQGQNDAS
ncbi:MAG: argininosuccinate synthase, partial [Chloroflexi bacterium]|nr:argininosuccinate synthase [Chloroflexota bacterium]